MSESHARSVITRRCKECDEQFSVTGDTISADLARGLSEPARCSKCRKAHGRFINSVGSGYFLERRRGKPHPRCAGKFGLGMIDHPDPQIREKTYELKPTEEQLQKFQILEPAVQRLIENLEDPQGTKVSILVGPTGTGKSVWAPTQILRSAIGREGRICVTQPRLVTLRTPKGKSDTASTPGFVAKSLLGADAVGAGQEVGLLYSGESSMSDRYTRLLYVTDGILIRWILSGQLGRFSVVMIDEAHEQSANMELIFALMRYHLPLYPRLRLVIMSATMDVQRFANFFGDGKPESIFVAAPDMPATLCQIHDRWPEGDGGYAAMLEDFALPQEARDAPKAMAAVVRAIRGKTGFTHLGNPHGDVLCFVPTVRLVEETVQAVRALGLPNLEAFSCHAQMDEDEVVALQKSEGIARTAMENGKNTPVQRVIVATNYAETSVTFANLRYVIDSGFIMEPAWDPITCSIDYPLRRHSQAGCTQRKGRVGRVQDGEVFRLYSQADFENPELFSKHPRPAIAREPLEKFLLAAKAAGVANLDGFQWLGFDGSDSLQTGERGRSLASLARHGVVDQDGDITPRGLELEGVRHASLDWSRAMSESDGMACALEVATFLAFSESQLAIFISGEAGLLASARWSQGCSDDLEFYLRLFRHWNEAGKTRSHEEHAAWSKAEGLNHKAFREIKKRRADALKEFSERTHTDLTERELDLARVERVRLVLTRALYPWIYVRMKDGSYAPLDPDICPCKTNVLVEQDSACDMAESPEAFLCVSRTKIREQIYAVHIVRIRTEWIEGAKAGSPLKIALLAASEAARAGSVSGAEGNSAGRIIAPVEEPLLPASFQKGDVRQFTVKRFKYGKKLHTVLAVDVASNRPVVLSFEGGMLAKGVVARAQVVDTANEIVLGVSQKAVVATYQPGKLIFRSSTKLIKEMRENESDDSPVNAHLFELEPGITGILRRHPDPRFWPWWNEYLQGRIRTLKVFKNDGKISLALHFPDPEVNSTYQGVVEEVKYDRNNGKVFGLMVLFLPGRTGLVYWKTVPRGTIESYKAGDVVSVRIAEIKRNQNGRELYDLTLN